MSSTTPDPLDVLRAKLSPDTSPARDLTIAATPEQQPVDPAADIRQRLTDAQVQRTQQNVGLGLDAMGRMPEVSLDDGALAQRLQQQGQPVPPEVVAGDRQRFRDMLQQQQAGTALGHAPRTASWLAAPSNAIYGRNEVDGLAALEWLMTDPSGWRTPVEAAKGFVRGMPPVVGSMMQGAAVITDKLQTGTFDAALNTLAVVRTLPGMREQQSERLRQMARHSQDAPDGSNRWGELADRLAAGEDVDTLMDEVRAAREQMTPAPEMAFYRWGETVSGILQETLAPRLGTEDWLTPAVAEGMGSIVPYILSGGAGRLLKIGSAIPNFTMATAAGVDGAYQRAREFGMDHQGAMRHALHGAPAGFIQAMSVEVLLRPLPPPAKRRWQAIVSDLAVTAGAEGVVESLGAIGQNLVAQRYDDEAGTFDDTVFQGFIGAASAGTLRGLMLALAPGARRGLYRDIERAERSKEVEQTFKLLAEGASASEMREKAPEAFRSWAASVTTGTPVETVHISAEGLVALAQSSNDPEIVQKIMAVLPGVDAAMFQRAATTGEDVSIPMATWLTDVVGTPVADILLAHVRLDPTQMTAHERRAGAAQMQIEMEAIRARVDRMGEADTSAATTPAERARLRLYDDVRSQLTAVGADARSAADAAAQYAQAYTRMAQRAGMSFEQFVEQFPYARVTADAPATAATQRAERAVSVPLADVLNELREGVAVSPLATAIAEVLPDLGIDMAVATNEEIIAALGIDPALLGEPVGRVFSDEGDGIGAAGVISALNPRPPLNQGPVDALPDLEKASPGPVPGVRALASDYMRRNGMPVRHQASYVKVDVERAREIARLYDEAVDSPDDPEVQAAYEALAAETIAQYEALLELGYTFEWIEGPDPYATPADAIRDMQNNKHLWVFPTTSGFGTLTEADARNPLLRETEYVIDGRKALVNDLFRIVHDVFGHGSEGASFGPRGEENAWQAHVRMFSPLAARAMTSETRGQNSWVNYGPFGEANRADPANTIFADQKTVLLPEWVSEVGQAEDKPQVLTGLFHGTRAGFTEFAGGETFTTNRRWLATEHAMRPGEGTPRVLNTTVTVTNPFEMSARADDVDTFWLRNTIAARSAFERGHDAVVIRNDAGDMMVVAAKGEQVGIVDPTVLNQSVMPTATVEPSRPQLPLRDDGKVLLYHWSATQRDVIDPAKAGTGPFTSRERRSGAKVSFYGINPRQSKGEPGTGYVKEPGLGPVMHIVAMDPEKLYPYHEDPDGLFDPRDMVEVKGTQYMRTHRQRHDEFVLAIMDAGYAGYYVTEDGSGRAPLGNVAVVWEAQTPETVVNEQGGTVLYQSVRPGDNTDTSWYYSALEQAVANAKQEKAMPGDWLAILPKLPGVKEAEIRWTMIEPWLEDRRENHPKVAVTRDELLARLQAERLALVTTVGTEAGGDAGVVGDEFAPFREEDRETLPFEGEAELTDWEIERAAYDWVISLRDERANDITRDELVEAMERRLIDDDHTLGDSEPNAEVINALVDADIDEVRQAAEDAAYEREEHTYYDEGGIEQITLSYGDTTFEITVYGYDGGVEMDGEHYRNLELALDAAREKYADGASEADPGVRFEQYTEDGGANYREVLLRVPNLHAQGPNRERGGIAESLVGDDAVVPFVQEAHFPQANVVVHARLSDREIGGAENTLFVEEIQSDLTSEWRKSAGTIAPFVRPMAEREAALTEARENYLDARAELTAVAARVDSAETATRTAASALAQLRQSEAGEAAITAADAAWREAVAAERALRAEQDRARTVANRAQAAERRALDAVVTDRPYTPFDDGTTYALMLKRLLNMAAAEGKDAIAWTPGYMQAERWAGQVQNVVHSVTWRPRAGSNAERTVSLVGVNGVDTLTVDMEGVIVTSEGGRIPHEAVAGKTLAEVLGDRALAERAMSEGEGTVSADNIVIGGDGYRIAYDQTMRKFMDKFAKKYDSKVEQAVFKRGSVEFEWLGTNEAREALETLDPEALARVDAEVARNPRVAGIRDELERARARLLGAEQGAQAAGLPSEIADGIIRRYANDVRTAEFDLDAVTSRLAERSVKNQLDYLVRTNPAARDKLVDMHPQVVVPDRMVWFVRITPEMRAAALRPQPLFQPNRGQIILPPPGEAPNITMFEGADPSTVLHEMGHHYLYLLQSLVEQAPRKGEDATLRADWQTINDWWRANAEAVATDGSKTGTPITAIDVVTYLDNGTTGDGAKDRAVFTGLHEQWARGFELYLREGRTPTISLRGVFARFRAMLQHLYSSAEKLDVKISPEMRGVFDRLFASQEEIAEAAAATGLGRLTAKDAKAMGLDEASWRELQRLQDEAIQEQEEVILREAMQAIRHGDTAEYKDARAVAEAEAEKRLAATPAQRAREWLANGRWLGDGQPVSIPDNMRLSRGQIAERYGAEMLQLLPRGRRAVHAPRGIDIDEAAGWFGFKSGDELVRTLAVTPKLADAVKADVDAQMAERFPDPMSDLRAEQAAIDALHGEKAGQLLVAEMRALSKAKGVKGKVPPRQQARETARRSLLGMTLRDATASHRWLAAERTAANQAAEALARGDKQAAFNAKRRQLINHMLYSESRKIADLQGRLERKAGRLKRKGTRENLAPDYLEPIDDVLQSYEFSRVSNAELDRRGKLRQFVAGMIDAGRENELAIPQTVLDRAQRVNYRELTVTEAQDVLDTLTNLEHLARFKKGMTDARDQRAFDGMVNEIVAAGEENLEMRPRSRVQTARDRRRRAIGSYLNSVLTAATLLRKIDGQQSDGPAMRYIKAPIDAATRWLTTAQIELAGALEVLYKPYSRAEQREMSVKKYYDFIDDSLSKWDIISIALNTGNADNLQRLTDPDSRGYTPKQLEQLLDVLDRRDWEFVQGTLDLINSYWPQIEAREKRLKGVAPRKVEALPIETKFGTFPGGYYPIVYDGELSSQVTDERAAELMGNVLAGRFAKAQTAAGHLEARKSGSGGRPLLIDISAAHMHLNRVLHDLAYSEAVSNSWRLLKNGRVRDMFARAGNLDDLDTLEVYVQDVATGRIVAQDGTSKVLRRLRTNFTLAKLALNMKTVLLQATGLAQSHVALGHRAMFAGYLRYMSAPREVTAEVLELSPLMRNRMTTMNKDMHEILISLNKGPAQGRVDVATLWAGKIGFWPMQRMQFHVVDMPTWIAAYQQAVANGQPQTEAAAVADAAVVRAQAGGDFSDISAIERGTAGRNVRQSEYVRLLTPLASYMFAKLNVAYERTARAKNVWGEHGFSGRSALEALSYSFDMLLLMLAEMLILDFLLGQLPGGDDEDDETWAEYVLFETGMSVAGMFPLARDMAGLMTGFEGGAYASILSTGARGLWGAGSLLGGMFLDQEVTKNDVKNFVNGVGLTTGLPSTAANRVIDGIWRLGDGQDVSPLEYLMGARK